MRTCIESPNLKTDPSILRRMVIKLGQNGMRDRASGRRLCREVIVAAVGEDHLISLVQQRIIETILPRTASLSVRVLKLEGIKLRTWGVKGCKFSVKSKASGENIDLPCLEYDEPP